MKTILETRKKDKHNSEQKIWRVNFRKWHEVKQKRKATELITERLIYKRAKQETINV